MLILKLRFFVEGMLRSSGKGHIREIGRVNPRKTIRSDTSKHYTLHH